MKTSTGQIQAQIQVQRRAQFLMNTPIQKHVPNSVRSLTQTLSLNLIFALSVIFAGCSQFVKVADRKSNDEIISEDTNPSLEKNAAQAQMQKAEFEKFAFELGLQPAGPLSQAEILKIRNRAQLRKLERAMQTDQEQNQYARILPLLQTDEEKIEYLKIPSIEGRLAWANRNKIWIRSIPDPKLNEVADRQDIAVGMTESLVRRAWGEPADVETSGNPIYRNQRWKYVKDVPTMNGYKRERRFVYFESGRVVGWETEQ